MPKKKYIVTLIDEERAALKELVNKGKNPAYKVNHARILLKNYPRALAVLFKHFGLPYITQTFYDNLARIKFD